MKATKVTIYIISKEKKHADRQIKQLKNGSKTVLILEFEFLKKCENFHQQRYTKTKHMQ